MKTETVPSVCAVANTAEQNLLLFYRIKRVFLKAEK